ncbi:MAG: hypothetical protein AAB365_03395 [Patescibacteria group bacterium]
MNDDLLTPKSQPDPAGSDAAPVPSDTEEQDTVSDRIFDFTDGDIKPVTDVDGPVTKAVNKQIAEALRNPAATVKPPTPQAVPVSPPATPASAASKPLAQPEAIPAALSSTKPIPHPPIDMSMQAPAVKVYSQIPHPPTQAPAPTQKPPVAVAEQPQSEPILGKNPTIAAGVTASSSLEDILKRVHTQTQATPPTLKENLLDKNIGNLESSPFVTQKTAPQPAPMRTAPANLTGGPQLVPSKPSGVPLQDFSQSLNKARNTPSNPPAKVIGVRATEYSAPMQSAPKNLQDAVSSVLPSDLREKGGPSIPVNPSTNASDPSNAFAAFLKPMRTYEGDVAEIMSHKRTSTASIAIAETKKMAGEERLGNDPESNPGSTSHALLKTAMAILIIVLLGGGAFGAYYLYSKSPLATSRSTSQAPQQQTRTGIVKSDSYALIATDNQLPANILSRIQTEAAKTQTPGSIKELVLGRKNPAGSVNAFAQISASEALEALDVDAPDILTRTLTPDWMLGIYNSPENTKGAFVIVTTNFFQNAFAGMLQWESVMADDLKFFLYPSSISGIANTTVATVPAVQASSTEPQASSTPVELVQPLRSYFTIRGRFEDRIIKNKDVRAFRTEDGSILFLYSFVDNTHLALASDEATLTEVLTRLEKQSSIR